MHLKWICGYLVSYYQNGVSNKSNEALHSAEIIIELTVVGCFIYYLITLYKEQGAVVDCSSRSGSKRESLDDSNSRFVCVCFELIT